MWLIAQAEGKFWQGNCGNKSPNLFCRFGRKQINPSNIYNCLVGTVAPAGNQPRTASDPNHPGPKSVMQYVYRTRDYTSVPANGETVAREGRQGSGWTAGVAY